LHISIAVGSARRDSRGKTDLDVRVLFLAQCGFVIGHLSIFVEQYVVLERALEVFLDVALCYGLAEVTYPNRPSCHTLPGKSIPF
jgi:hypothetical protein